MKKDHLKIYLIVLAIAVVVGLAAWFTALAVNKGSNKKSSLDSNTLAVVNGYKITKSYFDIQYKALPQDYQSMYKNNLEGFLEQLIVREILYQEAVQKGLDKKQTGTKDGEEKKDNAIREMLSTVSQAVTVSEAEMKTFYDQHPTEMQGASFADAKPSIEDYLLRQKQNDTVNQFITGLQQKATIVRNEKWLAIQQANKPKNPLTDALKSGKPTVLDLGSGTCIPCKMMKPIFAELEKEYQGKANIILLDINDYRDVANQYQVRVIPTQIFFDKNGTQNWRHEGFLAKEDIINKLKELGVN